MKHKWMTLVTVLFASCLASAQSWIVQTYNADCAESNVAPPLGGYSAPRVECNVIAVCGYGPFPPYSFIFADTYVGLACPNDTVQNNVNGAQLSTITISSSAIAFDLSNNQVRGVAYSQESCNTLASISYTKDYPEVCGQPPLPDPGSGDGGGDGGGGVPDPPIVCFYGPDGDGPTCVPDGPQPVQS